MRFPAIAAAALLLLAAAGCETAPPDLGFERELISSEVWVEAPALASMRVVQPANSGPDTPRTLVIGLHGLGGTAERFQYVAAALNRDDVIFVAPNAPYPAPTPRGGRDWSLYYESDRALSERAIDLFVDEHFPRILDAVREEHAVDRVYVLGFSQGAALALINGVRHADDVDGVIAFGLPEFDPAWFEPGELAAANQLRVLLFHGERDAAAPFQASERARDAFAAAGYDVRLIPFDAGHDVRAGELAIAAGWIGR